MKRFWDSATVVCEGAVYAIRLDGRPMRLPGGPVLALHSEPLARAIADEWQVAGGGKGGVMSAEDVPLTSIAGTAQERVAPDPASTVATLARYAEADLLCYRAPAPEALRQRQHEAWQPWLDWAAAVFGTRLRVTNGVLHVAQPPESLAGFRRALDPRPAFELAGLGVLVPALGSLVLGLAVADGALAAVDAHALSILDEVFQNKSWGEDVEAAARRRIVAADIGHAARFIALSRPEADASA